MSEVKRLSLDMQYPFQYMEEENGNLVYYKDYAELKAQRDALAAENAALKELFSTKEFSTEVADAFCDTAVLRIDGDDCHSWQWVDNDSEVIRAVLDAMKPVTPATDAYLNSVRAEGVDMVAESLIENGVCTSSHTVSYFKQFAAQLRAGKDGE